MTDAAPQSSLPAASGTDTRTLAIIVYGLYLGACLSGGLTGIAGLILAYIKRDEARGTIWHSHFENAIHAFWIWFVLMIAGFATAIFLIGFLVMGFATIYFLYRVIKGLIGAVESRPYV